MNPYLFVVLFVAILALAGGIYMAENREAPTSDDTQQYGPAAGKEVRESTDDQPGSIEVKDQAHSLNLSGKGLTAVPMYIFSETSVQVLNLSNNDLTGALPAEVRHMQNLMVLDLSDNNFTGVPAEVGQLSKLQLLDLSNNPITGLPYELGNLKALRILDLRGTNYASADLEIIREKLPDSVKILVD